MRATFFQFAIPHMPMPSKSSMPVSCALRAHCLSLAAARCTHSSFGAAGTAQLLPACKRSRRALLRQGLFACASLAPTQCLRTTPVRQLACVPPAPPSRACFQPPYLLPLLPTLHGPWCTVFHRELGDGRQRLPLPLTWPLMPAGSQQLWMQAGTPCKHAPRPRGFWAAAACHAHAALHAFTQPASAHRARCGSACWLGVVVPHTTCVSAATCRL